MSRELIIEFECADFKFENGKLIATIEDDSEINLIPNGIYLGYNFFKPFSLGTLRTFVSERITEYILKVDNE